MAVYTCHNPGSGVWTEDISNVTCIAPAITVLTQLQYINYIVLACILLALLWGFYYILFVPGYAHKMAHECVAQFVAFTGLRHEHFRNNHCDPFNLKKLLKFLPKAAKNTYILTYFPTSIGRFDTKGTFAGLEDRKRIPSFLHEVYMDKPTEHEEDCDHKHWKISDNAEHQILKDGTFGKVKCSFVYQYEPTCQLCPQTSRKGKEFAVLAQEHKKLVPMKKFNYILEELIF